MTSNIEDKFREGLTQYLLEECTSEGWLQGSLLNSPDLDEAWLRLMPSLYGDAVRNFNEYPEFCLGCAGYLGMAVAFLWDKDWEKYSKVPYDFFQGERKFDDMDDHITDTILHDRHHSVSKMQSLAASAYHFLMRETPEPGTALAYRLFLITVETMYRVGSSLELSHLGYKLEAIGRS